jgi:hypothetical protein
MFRWRLLRLFSAFALCLTLGVWTWSRFVWPDAVSICIGIRYADQYDPIVGLHDHQSVAWYYRTIIPLHFRGAIPDGARTIRSHHLVHLCDFQYIGYYAAPNDWYYAIGLPLWFLAIVFAGLLFLSLHKLKHRTRLGCCTKCGYDLRATPDRCPECGKEIAQPIGGIA